MTPVSRNVLIGTGCLILFAGLLGVRKLSEDAKVVPVEPTVNLILPLPLSEQLALEFDEAVPYAVEAFMLSVTTATSNLTLSVDDGFIRVRDQLQERAEELDGIKQRVTLDEAEAMEQLRTSYRDAMAAELEPGFSQFLTDYIQAYEQLQDDLLIVLPAVDAHALTGIGSVGEHVDLDGLCGEVSSWGSASIKTADLLVEWIPWLGDAYGFAKIAYDPRIEKLLKPEVDRVVQQARAALRDQLDLRFDEVVGTATNWQIRCQEAFDPAKAVELLEQRRGGEDDDA